MKAFGIFVTGFISGAATIIAIEGIRGLIIRKKNKIDEKLDTQEQEYMTTDAKVTNNFWQEVSKEEAEKAKTEEEQMIKDKYEEQAKRYHKSLSDMTEEDYQKMLFEELEESDKDDDEEEAEEKEIVKHKIIDDADAYFIEAEDAGYEYDLLDCIFCSDGVIVDTSTELPIPIETFNGDIKLNDITDKFILCNYEPIFIRDDRNGRDYSLEWTDQSYKEVYES